MCTAECVLKKSVRELTPVILGTWETEIRKIKVQGQFKPVSQKFPTRKTAPQKGLLEWFISQYHQKMVTSNFKNIFKK
jgi:hypothetical protein